MSPLLVLHVVISLIGIFAGFVVSRAFLMNRRFEQWTSTFLLTTIATSLTGFLLPAQRILPSHGLAVLSLIALGFAVYSHYAQRSSLRWNYVFIITVLLSQYFNVFVLVVQLFQKISVLKNLAPTQTEPIFGLTHLFVLLAFVLIGKRALNRLDPSVFADFPAQLYETTKATV